MGLLIGGVAGTTGQLLGELVGQLVGGLAVGWDGGGGQRRGGCGARQHSLLQNILEW